MEKQAVYSFKRNENEEVRVSIGEYKDKTYVDCRIFFETKTGDWSPTKKGITIASDLVPELIKGLEKASEAVSTKA